VSELEGGNNPVRCHLPLSEDPATIP
jgi:hypothetical protein